MEKENSLTLLWFHTNAHFREERKSILINSAWYIISKPNDYNPIHRHTEYTKTKIIIYQGRLFTNSAINDILRTMQRYNDFSGNANL